MKMIPIRMTPVITDSTSVTRISRFRKYDRFSTGSAARRSMSTNSGSSTTKASRNGHTSVDAREAPALKKSRFFRPYRSDSTIVTSTAIPKPSMGFTSSARVFGSTNTHAATITAQMGTFT